MAASNFFLWQARTCRHMDACFTPCSTHASFASPLEMERGKPSPTRSWILYGKVREFGDSEGSFGKRCIFFFTAFYLGINVGVLEVSLSAARSRKPAPKELQRQKEAEYVIQRTALLPMSRNVKHETIRSVAQTKATHGWIARRPNLKEFLFSSATETDIVEGSLEV